MSDVLEQAGGTRHDQPTARTIAVSAIIPTWNRPDRLLATIDRIKACVPAPDEIIVHIDAGDHVSGPALAKAHPETRILRSDQRMGPGGGRNRLVAAARNDIIASFDDDSFPVDADYFAAVVQLFRTHPEAHVVVASIFHDGESIVARSDNTIIVADFIGCGCAYRRQAFCATGGYVPLAVAYGMEEADLTLQIHDGGGVVLHSHDLRIRHATMLTHHAKPEVTAASISNLALLAYARYPWSHFGIGLLQVASRITWLIRNHRRQGVIRGILAIPAQLWRHRAIRRPVKPATLQIVRALRRGERASSHGAGP